MYLLMNKCRIKNWMVIAIIVLFLLVTVTLAQAADTLVTDRAEWEAIVSYEKVFETTQENIEKADEITSLTGLNDQVGDILTFQAINSGLPRGFVLETLQPGAAFTFNDSEDGIPAGSYQMALSIGDINSYEDDDWQLSLIDGVTMMAFGVEIRHSRFAPGESITLYSGAESVGTIDLSSLPIDENNYFLGIVSDVPFDRIVFNEDPDGDDIAIADFRFDTCIPRVEICDGLDNDCNGFIDDGIASTPTTCGTEDCAAATLVTNRTKWEAMLQTIEVFETTQENIEKADEVTTLTGINDHAGRKLTFRAINSGLSRGFAVETLQSGAGFTFNDIEEGGFFETYQMALSVGDINSHEDDDWQLSLL
ncbi:MAG: putative metal-binding motif-containing protein, partial [Pseudomonadota bacterium]